MIRCAAGGGRFGVQAYKGSTTAPAKKADNCPETISLLIKDGFEVHSVGYFDEEKDFMVYTLMR